VEDSILDTADDMPDTADHASDTEDDMPDRAALTLLPRSRCM
jgi:hypothetical protein